MTDTRKTLAVRLKWMADHIRTNFGDTAFSLAYTEVIGEAIRALSATAAREEARPEDVQELITRLRESWGGETARDCEAALERLSRLAARQRSLLVRCYPVIDGCGAGWLRAEFPSDIIHDAARPSAEEATMEGDCPACKGSGEGLATVEDGREIQANCRTCGGTGNRPSAEEAQPIAANAAQPEQQHDNDSASDDRGQQGSGGQGDGRGSELRGPESETRSVHDHAHSRGTTTGSEGGRRFFDLTAEEMRAWLEKEGDIPSCPHGVMAGICYPCVYGSKPSAEEAQPVAQEPVAPCPWCGEVPDVNLDENFRFTDGEKWGALQHCGMGPEVRTEYQPRAHWKQAAIEAWNKRPARSAVEATPARDTQPVAWTADDAHDAGKCAALVDAYQKALDEFAGPREIPTRRQLQRLPPRRTDRVSQFSRPYGVTRKAGEDVSARACSQGWGSRVPEGFRTFVAKEMYEAVVLELAATKEKLAVAEAKIAALEADRAPNTASPATGETK